MNKTIIFAVIVAIFTMGIASLSFSFDDDITHPALTERALEYDLFLRQYFLERLNIPLNSATFMLINTDDGIKPIEYERFINLQKRRAEKYVRYSALGLIATGAEAEDYPNLPFKGMNFFKEDPLYIKFGSRASHHFHDPTNEDYPGLDNHQDYALTWTIKRATHNLNDLRGISAGNRAIGSTPAPFGQENVLTAIPMNYFDWSDARAYYFKAITSSSSKDRNHYFALLFLSLGHIMHLVEDMAVPSHARNDFSKDHLFTLARFYAEQNFETYTETKKTKSINDLTLWDIQRSLPKELPNFWDAQGGQPMGLSEYAQPSFLSLGTLFQNYDQPNYSSTELNIEMSNFLVPKAYRKGTTILNEPINHLAAYSLEGALLHKLEGKSFLNSKNSLLLTSACYEDYAALLLPKAVAYASGVLKYFFRGRINAMLRVDGRLTMINESNHDMNGMFTLYYDAGGVRSPVPGGSWSLTLPAGALATTPGGITLPESMDHRSPLTLVFTGRLGTEENAVAARVFYPPNAMKIWRINYFNDNSRKLHERSLTGRLCYGSCCEWQYSGRWLFSHSGNRVAYYIMAPYYDPSGGDAFPLSNSAISSCFNLVPWNHNTHSSSFDGGPERNLFIFPQDPSHCGNPRKPEITDLLPPYLNNSQWLSELCPGSPSVDWVPWYFSSYSCFPGMWEVALNSARSQQVQAAPQMLDILQLRDFLKTLHPKLQSKITVPAGSMYLLFTMPVPEPRTYDLPWEERYETTNICCSQPVDYFLPDVWSVFSAAFHFDNGQALKQDTLVNDYIYGPDFIDTNEDPADNPSDPCHYRQYNSLDPYNSILSECP